MKTTSNVAIIKRNSYPQCRVRNAERDDGPICPQNKEVRTASEKARRHTEQNRNRKSQFCETSLLMWNILSMNGRKKKTNKQGKQLRSRWTFSKEQCILRKKIKAAAKNVKQI